jgi:hypothetical protein
MKRIRIFDVLMAALFIGGCTLGVPLIDEVPANYNAAAERDGGIGPPGPPGPPASSTSSTSSSTSSTSSSTSGGGWPGHGYGDDKGKHDHIGPPGNDPRWGNERPGRGKGNPDRHRGPPPKVD